jgi:hypothetical protein
MTGTSVAMCAEVTGAPVAVEATGVGLGTDATVSEEGVQTRTAASLELLYSLTSAKVPAITMV